MANTTVSPNMGMPVPVVGVDPGPDWATNVNSSLSIIDGHDHSTGKGVSVTPSGININADLSFRGFNAYNLRSARFSIQTSPISGGGTDINCLYDANGDLYFNDGSGNQVRITQSGSVAGATGTITGLPSGTASASYSAGTFTFQSATSTPANMSFGPTSIGTNTAGSKFVTLQGNASQAANYALTLPVGLPGATAYPSVDTSGNMGFTGTTGTGNIVLNNAPNFSGVPTGTITAAAYTPTSSNVTGFISAATGFSYMRIGNYVTVFGFVTGNANASGSFVADLSLPISPSSNFVNIYDLIGTVGFLGVTTTAKGQFGIEAETGSKLARMVLSIDNNATFNCPINFAYSCA